MNRRKYISGRRMKGRAKYTISPSKPQYDMDVEVRPLFIYDQLVEDELTRYLISHTETCDLIVSGDTFIYFGDLRDVVAASYACLRGDGSLIFTVESSEECQSYELQKNGRYRHNEQYVTQSLIDAGFTVLSQAIHTLRTEHGRPVAGLLVTARRLT
jgi:predicted TPR repeat methyltransferase